jgi:hypothetical protein
MYLVEDHKGSDTVIDEAIIFFTVGESSELLRH